MCYPFLLYLINVGLLQCIHPQEVLTLSATQLFERMKSAHPSVMRGMTAYSLSRILPQLGERVHTAKGNVYRVVACDNSMALVTIE